MVEVEVPEIDYTRYSNRQLVAVPLAVLAAAVLVLLAWSLLVTGTPTSPGSPVELGTDFTGGAEVTVVTATPQEEISAAFETEPTSIQPVLSEPNQYVVSFPPANASALENQADRNLEPVAGAGDVGRGNSEIDPTFGGQAQRTALLALGIAFLGMALLAFVLFRTFVPSVAIIASAASDILIPLALMNVFGIKLTLGTVAALLMLIGYSVDSDILLNDHILRRPGGFYESVNDAMRTGVTMTLTSISAMAAMAVIARGFGIDLMAAIGLVLVFGLLADLMNTYLMNFSLLRWYKFTGVAR